MASPKQHSLFLSILDTQHTSGKQRNGSEMFTHDHHLSRDATVLFVFIRVINNLILQLFDK